MPGRQYTQGPKTREGFTGHELDAETGLNYAGARYYMPALGRFTSTDPHAASYPGWSPYHYAANNPISVTDPTGMDWVCSQDGDGNCTSYSYMKGISSQGDLEEGSALRYVGAVHQYDSVEGLIDLRADGTWRHAPTIGPARDNWLDKWAASDNFVAQMLYAMVDGPAVAAQALVLDEGAQRHIDGTGVSARERLDSLPSLGVALGPLARAAGAAGEGSLAFRPSLHSVNQKINRGIRSIDELDALRSPLSVSSVRYDALGRPSVQYIGNRATIGVNPSTGRMTSVWPTSTRRALRLGGNR